MDLEEYNEKQQTLTAALVAYVLRFFWPFRSPPLTNQSWLSLLQAVYPEVERYRYESARLGRQFYDAQREKYAGTSSRHDAYLSRYEFPWFQEAMEPARREFLKPGASDSALSEIGLRAAKEVENGGRRTILRAVESDPEVQAWARVATGNETCGFCMMLVSRGPVYFSAEDAGMNLDDTSALEAINSGDEKFMKEHMTEWHTGCDCKVVPVFDRQNWPGRDAYLKAEQFYKDIARKVEADPDTKKPKAGNQHKPMNRTRSRTEAIMNEMRLALESGEVDPMTFAAVA